MKNATFDTFNHQKTTFITYFVKIQSRNNVARPQNETVHTSSLKKIGKEFIFLQHHWINKSGLLLKYPLNLLMDLDFPQKT